MPTLTILTLVIGTDILLLALARLGKHSPALVFTCGLLIGVITLGTPCLLS